MKSVMTGATRRGEKAGLLRAGMKASTKTTGLITAVKVAAGTVRGMIVIAALKVVVIETKVEGMIVARVGITVAAAMKAMGAVAARMMTAERKTTPAMMIEGGARARMAAMVDVARTAKTVDGTVRGVERKVVGIKVIETK
ncbi:hypothetical protein [Roseibium sediminis]|uniref:hypothetical protein n=1 Tax=Roseibium sediminis TaxID=1775174 RepID=UPI001FCB78D5|nr:hypothetical protein [Roseibium sediminis]